MDSFKLETNFKDLNLGKHFAAAKGALRKESSKMGQVLKPDPFFTEKIIIKSEVR